MIVVYTQEQCMPCKITKRKLTDINISFQERRAILEIDFLKRLGYTSAPVVTVLDETTGELLDSWSGFNVDKLKSLKED